MRTKARERGSCQAKDKAERQESNKKTCISTEATTVHIQVFLKRFGFEEGEEVPHALRLHIFEIIDIDARVEDAAHADQATNKQLTNRYRGQQRRIR